MKYFAGLDIGSLTCDAVILNERKEILGQSIVLTGCRNFAAMQKALGLALEQAHILSHDLSGKTFTGYGRELAADGDSSLTEIACHAKGARFLYPNTRLVIDIGGQDVKAIGLERDGRVKEFVMNDKCAAGTGRFLETMARALELDLDTFGKYAAKADKHLTISAFCTVFAESEVVSLVANGEKVENIVAALCRAIAERTASLARRVTIADEVTLTGGAAKNEGLVSALEACLGRKANIPAEPQIVGALGAALNAMEREHRQRNPLEGVVVQ
jgi:predicted CoA-substrate-specific enzyme activase